MGFSNPGYSPLNKLAENTGAALVGSETGENVESRLGASDRLHDVARFETMLICTAYPSLAVGDITQILDRGNAYFEVVLTSTVIVDGYSVVQCADPLLSLKLVVPFKLDVAMMGAKVGTDSAGAHNAAAAYCRLNGCELTAQSNVIYTVNSTVDFRSVKHVDYKAQITGTGEFVTVLLGGDSNDTSQYYQQYVFKANRGGTLPAVRIVGSNKNKISVGEASIIELYADTMATLGGTDEYCAYNKIFVQSCTTFQINSNAGTDGSVVQWINENKIYLDFCLHFKIFDNGYSHNSNQIYGGNFEAVDSSITLETGTANTFHGVRGESALTVTFGVNANNNTVLCDWISYLNAPANAATVVNNGNNNVVKNINDLTNERVTLMTFNGSTLTDNGVVSNLMGVSTALVKDAVNNTVSVSPYQNIYTSPLLEIEPKNEYFDLEVSPKLSGGIKMSIEGFDSDMNAIVPGDFDVFYQGATNEEAGFGEYNTSITNKNAQRRIYVNNTNAKYIKIYVSASSAGVSFRRFTLFCVSASLNGRKVLETSAMIHNIG